MRITEELGKRILFFDGGLGSILQEKGLAAGELPETWNLTHKEQITEVAYAYLAAGADIVNMNTFGANRLKFPKGSDCDVETVITAAFEAAQEAVKRIQAKEPDRKCYIALDVGPTGKLLKPMGDLDFEDAVDIFAEQVRIGARLGVDLINIETMSDLYEAKAAVLAAKENCDLPVFATVIFSENGKLLTGGTPETVVATLEGLGITALGVNCGLGPVQMKPMIKRLLDAASVPVIVNPNAGLPRSENGRTVYDITPAEFADEMSEIIDMGVWVAGGCCGTTPEHIHEVTRRCRDKTPLAITPKNKTMICSYAKAVEFGKCPVLVGERINPTGKSKFKQALRDNNMEYILQEGLNQEEKGAHVLDVNVGLPGIDETAMLTAAVTQLQSILDLPLQIDTSSAEAMEAALRRYNGKALINSVNGKQESMDMIFPLVKKYGGVVVALLLDESGIPETAEGRMAIAEKILQEGGKYGLSAKDFLFDGLAMTVSSDNQAALATLETIYRITHELHAGSILGVSNISFGLPRRDIINGTFFTMALQNGLSAAIMNPGAENMVQAYDAFLTLTGQDENCQAFTEKYAGTVAPAARKGAISAGGGKADGKDGSITGAAGASDVTGKNALSGAGARSLGTCIERGLKEGAEEAAALLLTEQDSLTIINEEMIPALDRVGKGFEKGTVFLPQLLMSAEAAKAAFAVIKNTLAASGKGDEPKKGTIILATVKGDIHDIGKNIVKVLLENYGYDVLDLGKDVPPETIVETAIERDIRLVGLSALMTTTVVSMEETIRLLREKKPGTKVMVGGAVLTEDYAKSIDADFYGKDAMASVRYAESLFCPE